MKTEAEIKQFIDKSLLELKTRIGDKKVLLALSGGVDSAVCAALLSKATNNLTCVFVNHGLMRLNEPEEIDEVFNKKLKINLISIDAETRFLDALKGVTDPEQKRKIIGELFIRVFEEQAKKIGAVEFLAQGTIYADIIESGKGGKLVKSHHNVGGLPSVISFNEILEPLKTLYKEEVRAVGAALGLPEFIVKRQPFPGPGLAVRVIGDITKQKLDILRKADFIFRAEVDAAKLKIWQYFTVLTSNRSVGVSNGERTYGYTLALRAVNSSDGMTAEYVEIPHNVLRLVSNKITSEVPEITRVVYDITNKPPSTIEWE